MNNHQNLDGKMRYRVVERLKPGLSQEQIFRDYIVSSSVMSKLRKLFSNTRYTKKNLVQTLQRRTMIDIFSITMRSNRDATASKLSHNSYADTEKPVSDAALIHSEGYMRKSCLQKYLPSSSCSLLRTGEGVQMILK